MPGNSQALVDSSGQTDRAMGLYSSYKGGRGGHPLNSELRNTKQVHLHTTAVSCSIQMKASGKQVFLSFRSYYPLYGYNHKSQKVYFYK